jgi:hypothetical protein
MHLKLVFGYSSSELFKVTASSTGRKHSPEPVVVLFKDERVFLSLLDRANVGVETRSRLVQAINASVCAPSSAACCAQVELSREELQGLRLEIVLSQNP